MTARPEDPAAETAATQRLDRWLWFARFVKSRTLAAKLVASGKIRVNRERAQKASRLVRAGDVLTFPLGSHIRVIKILAPGTRRGPASEAQRLYEDLSPPPQPRSRKRAKETKAPAGPPKPTGARSTG